MKQRTSFWVQVLLFLLTLTLAACGTDLPGLGGGSSSSGGGSKKKAPPTSGLVWIDVEPWPSATIYIGGTQKFTATGWYNDASSRDLTSWATWSSTNTTVATVSSSGVATGKVEGYADINASYGGIDAWSSTLYVDPVPAQLLSIAITPADPSIMAGDTQQFTATGSYDDNSTSNITSSVTWDSSNPSVATIGTYGLATGQGQGTTTISASKDGVTGTTTLSVVTLTSIDVDPVNTEVQETATRQFTATAHYSDASSQDITSSSFWTSSDPSIAYISNSPGTEGLATGMAIGGPVTITATKSGINGTASLLVTGPKPELSVRVNGVISNGTSVGVSYTVKNAGLANATDFYVDVWADSATAPVIGDSGDSVDGPASLAAGATLNGSVIIPSNLASGTVYAVVDTSDSIDETDETNNISAGYPWPFNVSCADVVNKFGGLCYDVANGFILNAPAGGYLSFGGYTFDDSTTSGIGPKNICSLAMFGDGGVVLGVPTSATTSYDGGLTAQQHWYGLDASCGYTAALIEVGTPINWTSYPVGNSCSGDTDLDSPTVSLSCTYPVISSVIAPLTYDFNDSSVPADFTMSGNLPWFIDGTTLRSGVIGDSQTSCFAVTVSFSSGVSFDFIVSSEDYYDRLRFYVDGSAVASWSDTVSWTTWTNVDYPQTFGTHEYKWCYTKDSIVSDGSDAAWVDNISIY